MSSAVSSTASTIVTANSATVLTKYSLRQSATKEKKIIIRRSRIVIQIFVESPPIEGVEVDTNVQVEKDSKILIRGNMELDVSSSITVTPKLHRNT